MANGTITATQFNTYLAVEQRFVRTAARILGYCVWQAPTWDVVVEHAQALQGLVGEQSDYFIARVVGPTVALPVGHDALDVVVHEAVSTGYPAVITCLAAAETLYLDWCRAAVQEAGGHVPGLASEWIHLHTTPEFMRSVGALHTLLDSTDPGVLDDTQLDFWFNRMLAAEDRFHDSTTSEGTPS
ncbi:hypothetical protein [Raineyella sp. LH-20]|uniref:hypothetical protein n=1 Tax=Raineyella sp. LH-20 TaxID=3081204 RepID=UPI0029543C4E|nr:hypothetical protein [Raineyella sp. LH-20]WOP18649.1 hypothetical protein R0146_15845 [Raineyella sp. LH-20]